MPSFHEDWKKINMINQLRKMTKKLERTAIKKEVAQDKVKIKTPLPPFARSKQKKKKTKKKIGLKMVVALLFLLILLGLQVCGEKLGLVTIPSFFYQNGTVDPFLPLKHQHLQVLYPQDSNRSSGLLDFQKREKMGLPIILPFYSQNGSVEGLLDGLNFGSSVAPILNTGNFGFQSLNHQLRQVFETIQILQLQVGQDNATKLFQSSVFYISLGKDDYAHLFQHDISGVRRKYSGRAFSNILVKQMIRVVKNLYNANARKIVCMGIRPLGCSPRALWESYNSNTTPTNRTSAINLTNCAEDINQLVLQYNAMLSAGLMQLNTQLPDTQIIFCDAYQGMAEIMHNPELYGFSNVRDACCGLGRYGGMVGCVSEDLACRDPSQHFWWDFYNPTQGVNALLANWSWNGQPHRLCRPFNIQQLAAEHLNFTHP